MITGVNLGISDNVFLLINGTETIVQGTRYYQLRNNKKMSLNTYRRVEALEAVIGIAQF